MRPQVNLDERVITAERVLHLALRSLEAERKAERDYIYRLAADGLDTASAEARLTKIEQEIEAVMAATVER